MRVLCTGTAGFISSHVAEALIARGDTVIGVDDFSGGEARNLPKQPHNLFRFYQMDLANYSQVREIFLCERPQILFHAAANARESSSYYDPYRIIRQNIYISSILLELGVQFGVEKVVFLSSMATYGSKPKLPFQESADRLPVDIYGEAKLATERMIQMLAKAHGFKWTVILPHNVYGPRQSLRDPFRNVVGIQMNRLMRGEPLSIYGSGHKRAFSFIGDSLPCFIRALDLNTANGETINLGGKIPVTIREMTEKIVSCFPEYPKPEIVELPPRFGEVENAYSSHEKSEKLLGYDEKVGWERGVEIMAEWAKKIGPQEWMPDSLAIPTKDIPQPWKDHLARLR